MEQCLMESMRLSCSLKVYAIISKDLNRSHDNNLLSSLGYNNEYGRDAQRIQDASLNTCEMNKESNIKLVDHTMAINILAENNQP